jgi:hypothetical protein
MSQYISGQYETKMPLEKINTTAWRRAFQQLATRGDWIQMKELVVNNESCGNMHVCGKDVAVFDLIEYCHSKDHEHRLWGQKLAISLMERGSRFPKASAVALMKKVLDCGIDTGRISDDKQKMVLLLGLLVPLPRTCNPI